MKRKSKALEIAPTKANSGVHDVSVNHDRYLAEFTYARKIAGPVGYRTCPFPTISYFDEVSSASAKGPRQ